MPDNGQLSSQDADIVVRLMSGQTVSPQERQHIIALAASTPPADPRHEALAKAAAVAQGNMGGVLPSAGGAAPTPAAASTPSPAASAFAQSIYATPNINAQPAGTGAPTLDWLQGVGNLISNPSNTGPAQVLGATNAPQTPIRPGSPISVSDLAQATSPTINVADKIAQGGYAGNALGVAGGGAAPDNASDVGATTAPPTGGGGLLGWLQQHQPTMDWAAASSQSNEDPNSPAAKQALLQQQWSDVQTNGGLPYGGGSLSGQHGIVHPDLGSTAGLPTPGDFSGYSFENLNPIQRNLLMSDQSGALLEALALAQQQGGGQDTAHQLQPFVQSAMALAPTGALGGVGVSGAGVNEGPGSSAYQLKAAEDYINQFIKPNAYVAPQAMMQTVLDRMNSTPIDQFSKLTSLGIPDATGATNTDDQITATNNALTAAGVLTLAPDSQKMLGKLLAMTEIQYKEQMLNTQGPLMSYPAYLQQSGITKMFGG